MSVSFRVFHPLPYPECAHIEFIHIKLTAQDVIKKFKNLRTTYCRELHKVRGSQRSGAGLSDVVTSSWAYFLCSGCLSVSARQDADVDNEHGMIVL